VSDLVWPTSGYGPVPDALPPEVWVAVVLVTRQVAYKDVPATAPLSGYDALFAPVRTEARLSALVVAAAVGRDECEQALADWKAAHPETQGDTVVSSVRLGRQLSVGSEAPASTPAQTCIGCGSPISGGFRCERCTKAHWEAMREVDPDYAKAEV
jgi:hypothetical protein